MSPRRPVSCSVDGVHLAQRRMQDLNLRRFPLPPFQDGAISHSANSPKVSRVAGSRRRSLWARMDLNHRPVAFQTTALPTELRTLRTLRVAALHLLTPRPARSAQCSTAVAPEGGHEDFPASNRGASVGYQRSVIPGTTRCCQA